jgi:hypothetical protein
MGFNEALIYVDIVELYQATKTVEYKVLSFNHFPGFQKLSFQGFV